MPFLNTSSNLSDERNKLAALGVFPAADQAAQLQPPAAQAPADAASKYGGAGIQAAGSLLAGLLAQKAQQQAQERAIASNVAQMQAEEQSKSMATTQQAQQNAFTRLMSSFRSALT